MSNRPNEMNQLEEITKPLELIIPKDNLDPSVFSRLRSSLASVKPDQKRIPCKNIKRKHQIFYNLKKETIRKTVNPRKISQEDSLMHSEKKIPRKISRFDITQIMKAILMKRIVILMIQNLTIKIL